MSANKEVIDQADVELLSKINTETKRNGRKRSDRRTQTKIGCSATAIEPP